MQCYQCHSQIQETCIFCPRCGTQTNVNETVIQSALNQNQQAIAAIYHIARTPMYNEIHLLVASPEDCEELYQDALEKVLAHLDQLKDPAKFRAWAKVIARNTAIDFLRRQGRFAGKETHDEEAIGNVADTNPDAQPVELTERSEVARQLNTLLHELPDDQRVILVMQASEQVTYREIAEQMGLNENTVRSKALYAKRKLRVRIMEMRKAGIAAFVFVPLNYLGFLIRKLDEFDVPDVPDGLDRFLKHLTSAVSGISPDFMKGQGNQGSAHDGGSGAAHSGQTEGNGGQTPTRPNSRSTAEGNSQAPSSGRAADAGMRRGHTASSGVRWPGGKSIPFHRGIVADKVRTIVWAFQNSVKVRTAVIAVLCAAVGLPVTHAVMRPNHHNLSELVGKPLREVQKIYPTLQFERFPDLDNVGLYGCYDESGRDVYFEVETNKLDSDEKVMAILLWPRDFDYSLEGVHPGMSQEQYDTTLTKRGYQRVERDQYTSFEEEKSKYDHGEWYQKGDGSLLYISFPIVDDLTHAAGIYLYSKDYLDGVPEADDESQAEPYHETDLLGYIGKPFHNIKINYNDLEEEEDEKEIEKAGIRIYQNASFSVWCRNHDDETVFAIELTNPDASYSLDGQSLVTWSSAQLNQNYRYILPTEWSESEKLLFSLTAELKPGIDPSSIDYYEDHEHPSRVLWDQYDQTDRIECAGACDMDLIPESVKEMYSDSGSQSDKNSEAELAQSPSETPTLTETPTLGGYNAAACIGHTLQEVQQAYAGTEEDYVYDMSDIAIFSNSYFALWMHTDSEQTMSAVGLYDQTGTYHIDNITLGMTEEQARQTLQDEGYTAVEAADRTAFEQDLIQGYSNTYSNAVFFKNAAGDEMSLTFLDGTASDVKKFSAAFQEQFATHFNPNEGVWG